MNKKIKNWSLKLALILKRLGCEVYYKDINFSMKITFAMCLSFLALTFMSYGTETKKKEDNVLYYYGPYKIPELTYIHPSTIKAINFKVSKKDTFKNRREKLSNKFGIHIPKSLPKEHLDLIINESKKYNLPQRMVFRLIRTESRSKDYPNGFDPHARNPSGAYGYMQIMPKTFDALSKKIGLNEQTPKNNLLVGIYYINYLKEYWITRCDDNYDLLWKLVIASYNNGLGRVINDPEIYSKNKTKKYVDYILD